MKSPFPYFGGKRTIADVVWSRLGSPKQYIEPFCGSAAILLSAPSPASLEVVGDANGFIANFWRAVVHQHAEVARWCDYPVSHVDLGARHVWLMAQRDLLSKALQDPDWPGDAKVAGWWLWGQCAWIGSGWCEWKKNSQIPHVGNAGMGIQAIGKIPHVSDAGRGIQAIGKIPHVSDAGRGMWTSGGVVALRVLGEISQRLERVRVVHGDWDRCLNSHYGGSSTAVFLDPPYKGFGELYGAAAIVDNVEAWARENSNLRVALCGHVGDYTLDGWEQVQWDRGKLTYSGGSTAELECVWFSPACERPKAKRQVSLFDCLASGNGEAA
jgi:DNA adenine methylase